MPGLLYTSSHIRNDRPNKEGRTVNIEFELSLFQSSTPNAYDLRIVSRVVIDFNEYSKLLRSSNPDADKPEYRAHWAEGLKQVVEAKWNGFRLLDHSFPAFSMRVTVECTTLTPETKSDYHTWIWIHPTSSLPVPWTRSYSYRGHVHHLRPVDIDPNGFAAHEFGHMIGVTHYSDRGGDRLMYGNDNLINEKYYPIRNAVGYVYPEIDLAFHRDWAKQALSDRGLIGPSSILVFDPVRRK